MRIERNKKKERPKQRERSRSRNRTIKMPNRHDDIILNDDNHNNEHCVSNFIFSSIWSGTSHTHYVNDVTWHSNLKRLVQ